MLKFLRQQVLLLIGTSDEEELKVNPNSGTQFDGYDSSKCKYIWSFGLEKIIIHWSSLQIKFAATNKYKY